MLDARPSPWAVVVDDLADDAMGIINALSLLGIPAVRYDGDSVMPEEPLDHVRLLFLDLDLGSGTADMKRTVGAVLRILAPSSSSGPCLIVLWTAHEEEDGEEFRQEFSKYNKNAEPLNKINPLDIIALDKKSFWASEDEGNHSASPLQLTPIPGDEARKLARVAHDVDSCGDETQQTPDQASRTTEDVSGELCQEVTARLATGIPPIASAPEDQWLEETGAATTENGAEQLPVEAPPKATPDGTRVYSHVRLKSKLKEALAPYKSLAVLLRWEAINGYAAAKTAAGLFYASELSAGNGDSDTSFQDMLAYLAKGSLGKNTKNANENRIRAAAFEIMAVLHADMVQRMAYGAPDAPLLLPTTVQNISAQYAALNTIILTSSEHDPLQPGAVFAAKDTNTHGIPFRACASEKSYRQFLSCIFKQTYRKPNKMQIEQLCTPVFVEITPGCDHAQEKRRMLRFLPGILVPSRIEPLLPRRADHLRTIGPLMHQDETVTLVLDTLHFFTLPLTAGLPQALFRLRDHVRTDIQAWLASQIARPGHTSLDAEAS